MVWTLVSRGAPDGELQPSRSQLQDDSTVFIALVAGSVKVVQEILHGMIELGQITSGPWGVKLEAIKAPLSISPQAAGVPSEATQVDKYQLQHRTSERSEIMLLRRGDVITSSISTASLTLEWEAGPEVQVNSSAVEVGVHNPANRLDGDETEDEDRGKEDDETTTAVRATQTKSQTEATPQLSNQPSLIVQETPTANRTSVVPNNGAIPMSTDVFSTAPTAQSENTTNPTIIEDSEPMAASDKTPGVDRHPKVVISKKRPSPVPEGESEKEHTGRSSKRVKNSDNESQDSRLDHIVVNSPARPETKGKKRESSKETEEPDEGTPSRSRKVSQRSEPAASAGAELYQGDTPCIATSNSAITEKGHAYKFLKKQGGSLVDSVKKPFNILCTRDGSLHKTPKVLLAIAEGTPIVTDKWLLDSAKAGQFLSTADYIPSAPVQETDWNFKLQNVVGKKQKPFAGYTVHFTTTLHSAYKDFSEIERVCKAAGAEKVTKKKMDNSDSVIVFAAEQGDKDMEFLTQNGIVCYNRDLLPMSIFRGEVDLNSDEFKIIAGDTGANAAEQNISRRRTKT